MPTVTDRRALLRAALAAALPAWWTSPHAAIREAPLTGGAGGPPRLAAAWSEGPAHHVGLWTWRDTGSPGGRLDVHARVEVPTRAHGLCLEPAGTLLSVARRPGDWLLRWSADGRALQWCWIEPDRAFNGHVLHSPDGRTLYTTETDLETGAGLLGVRDARSLRKRAEWPTGGQDPHELLWCAASGGTPDRIVVANGGIPTRPETGRVKVDLDRMDASLACLDATTGRQEGRWRLPDGRLSVRHLAWHTAASASGGRCLGIALQAEHDDPQQRAQAPVLAVWDGRSLNAAAPGPEQLGGYGGDIAATPLGFAVSAPKAGQVGLWATDGRWLGSVSLPEPCALAGDEAQGLWMGGPGAVARITRDGDRDRGQDRDGHRSGDQGRDRPTAWPVSRTAGPRLDNHWILL